MLCTLQTQARVLYSTRFAKKAGSRGFSVTVAHPISCPALSQQFFAAIQPTQKIRTPACAQTPQKALRLPRASCETDPCKTNESRAERSPPAAAPASRKAGRLPRDNSSPPDAPGFDECDPL